MYYYCLMQLWEFVTFWITGLFADKFDLLLNKDTYQVGTRLTVDIGGQTVGIWKRLGKLHTLSGFRYKVFVLATLFPIWCSSQGIDIRRVQLGNEVHIQMGLREAQVIDYWARKGIVSDPIIESQTNLIAGLYENLDFRQTEAKLLNATVVDAYNTITILSSKYVHCQSALDSANVKIDNLTLQLKSETGDRLKAERKVKSTQSLGLWLAIATGILIVNIATN